MLFRLHITLRPHSRRCLRAPPNPRPLPPFPLPIADIITNKQGAREQLSRPKDTSGKSRKISFPFLLSGRGETERVLSGRPIRSSGIPLSSTYNCSEHGPCIFVTEDNTMEGEDITAFQTYEERLIGHACEGDLPRMKELLAKSKLPVDTADETRCRYTLFPLPPPNTPHLVDVKFIACGGRKRSHRYCVLPLGERSGCQHTRHSHAYAASFCCFGRKH